MLHAVIFVSYYLKICSKILQTNIRFVHRRVIVFVKLNQYYMCISNNLMQINDESLHAILRKGVICKKMKL